MYYGDCEQMSGQPNLEERVYNLSDQVGKQEIHIAYMLKTHEDFKEMLARLCSNIEQIKTDIHSFAQTERRLENIEIAITTQGKDIQELQKTRWIVFGAMLIIAPLVQLAIHYWLS